MKTLTKEEQGRICPVMTILTPDLRQRLDVIAEKKVINRSVLIRQACEKYLRELEAEAAWQMTALASAREAESLSIEEIASRAEISVDYLKRIEKQVENSGGCSISYPLALRLARLYRQSANVFLTKGQSGDRQKTDKRKPAKDEVDGHFQNTRGTAR